jgi:RimJ/RimL family protein N-acetyltransferase
MLQSDLTSLVRYANNWEIAKNMTNRFPFPYTQEDGQAFIDFCKGHNPLQIFVIDIEGNLCGAIGIHPQADIHAKNAELGYWLAQPFWGQGIISEAIRQMLSYGFETFEINRIFAKPFGSNMASQKVLEKTGFKLEARFSKTLWKKDRYEDELVYAVRK